jgi:hypothetical protein
LFIFFSHSFFFQGGDLFDRKTDDPPRLVLCTDITLLTSCQTIGKWLLDQVCVFFSTVFAPVFAPVFSPVFSPVFLPVSYFMITGVCT